MWKSTISRVLLVCMATIALAASAQSPTDHEMFEFNRRLAKQTRSYIPKGGFVPDKDTAIAVAYAVALPVFGKKQLDEEKPLQAELKDGVWTVQGTLNCSSCAGGTLVMQINKATGRILFMIHTQ